MKRSWLRAIDTERGGGSVLAGEGRVPSPIDREQVRRLMAAGAQIVEVLPADEYAPLHLPGALNIPLKDLDARSATRLRRGVPIVTYCHDFQ